MSLRVALLAGGEGSRLWPFTRDTPKPMLPFCDLPVLEGWLRRLAQMELRAATVLAGPDGGPFDELLAAGQRLGVHVTVRTEAEPLGTGGAVGGAFHPGCDRLLVIKGDVVTGADLTGLLARHVRRKAAVTMLTVRRHDAREFGVVASKGTRVLGLEEKPEHHHGPGWVNAGVYVFERSVLRFIAPLGPSDLAGDVVPASIDAGLAVEQYRTLRGWEDIGTPRRYLRAHVAALNGYLTWPRRTGSVELRPGVSVHPQARIEPSVRLRAPVLIGPGVRVGPGATIGPDAVLCAGSEVGPGARVRHAVVLRSASVEPDVLLRDAVWAGNGLH